MAFSMTDEELKKRIKNGTPIKILAELNGCSDQTIYNWMKKNGVERPTDEKEKPKGATVPKKAIEVTLLEARKQHAETVEDLHKAEASYKAAQDSEMGFRAIVLGLEMLLEKGGASE